MERSFHHALPSARLGTGHASLASFTAAVAADGLGTQHKVKVPTEFSLVVILSPTHQDGVGDANSSIRILLGKKLRGFGTGFCNCFGGKLEKSRGEHAHPAKGAVRELQEETGIAVPLAVMEEGFVGNIHFTFEDCNVNGAMKVHLYCVFVSLSNEEDGALQKGGNAKQQMQQCAQHTPVSVNPAEIRGCDEIEPRWFDDIYDIPLSQMFADDSVWLTKLLTHYDARGGASKQQTKFMFDAWFHFHPGGTETNSIMHHFMQVKEDSASKAPKYSLDKRLSHTLHDNRIQFPSIKESFRGGEVGRSMC